MSVPVGRLAGLEDIRPLTFQGLAAPDRRLVPVEAGSDVPFEIRRVFSITAERIGLVGGRHAHRACSQVLVCLSGGCEIVCRADPQDGERRFHLDDPASGLFIPPGIWAEQIYTTNPTVLMVLCDRPFEAADYLRDYDGFVAYRRGSDD